MNPLKQHPIVTLGVIIFFAVSALVVFRLSSGAKTDTRKARVITVATAAPLKQDLDVRLTYTADITPNQAVNLFSRVDGYIAKVYVEKGDLVKANQLLIEIDHTDYRHAVSQAKANLAAARARVAQQDASVRNTTLTLNRMQTLIKDQFVSQQDLDNAQVSYDAAAAALDSLRAQVQQLEVALAQAETNLAYSYIRAPFPGYVAERNLDLGRIADLRIHAQRDIGQALEQLAAPDLGLAGVRRDEQNDHWALDSGLEPVDQRLPLLDVALDERGRQVENRSSRERRIRVQHRIAQKGDHRQLELSQERFQRRRRAGARIDAHGDDADKRPVLAHRLLLGEDLQEFRGRRHVEYRGLHWYDHLVGQFQGVRQGLPVDPGG